jgi:hypothetical protein
MEYINGETLANTESLKAVVAVEEYEYKYDYWLRNSAFSPFCGVNY